MATSAGPSSEPAPFRRTLTATTTGLGPGLVRAGAAVDDPLHGFEVDLAVRDGTIVRAEARSSHHPWTTCPGALGSVADLGGAVGDAYAHLVAEPVSGTCVHVNDLVWFATRLHPRRTYVVDVDRDGLVLRRDDEPTLSWPLEGWRIVDGPFAGLLFRDPGWPAALDRVGADVELREAVKVARRGLMVAIGYHEIDWHDVRVGADIPHDVMAGTCHTFSEPRIHEARCLVRRPHPESGI